MTTQAAAEQTASRRPITRLCTLAGGHVLHFEKPIDFAAQVKAFLEML